MNASQVELEGMLADYTHSSLHAPIDYCEDGSLGQDESEFSEEIGGLCCPNFLKCFWYSLKEIRLPTKESSPVTEKDTEGNENEYVEISGRIDKHGDILISTDVEIAFPAARVREPYRNSVRLSWSHNPCCAYIINVSMKYGSLELDSFEGSWIDTFYQWNDPSGLMGRAQHDLGNRAEMYQWNTVLKSQICKFELPFFYSYSLSSGFPLFLLNSQTEITQCLKYRKNPIKELLRVEVTKDGNTWVPGRFSKESIEIKEFKRPNLISNYCNISDWEKTKKQDDDLIVIPIRNIVKVTSNNTIGYGTDEVSLKTNDPVIAIFSASRNEIASKVNNNHHNFTNNPCDVRQGNYPVSAWKCKYDKIEKFNYSPSDMNSSCMLRHFKSLPHYAGYYAHAFTITPFDTRGFVGVIMKAGMTPHLINQYADPHEDIFDEEKNISASETSEVIESMIQKTHNKKTEMTHEGNKYITETHLMIHRDLVFKKEVDPVSKGFHFELSLK